MNAFGIPYKRRHVHYLVGDTLSALAAIQIGHLLRWGTTLDGVDLPSVLAANTTASLIYVASTLVVLYVADAYNSTLDFRRRHEIYRLWVAVAVALLVQMLAHAAFPHGWWGRGVAVLVSLSAAVLLTTWRAAFWAIGPSPVSRRRTLIVGSGQTAQVLAQAIRDHHDVDRMYDVVGCLEYSRPGNRRRDDHAEDSVLAPTPGGPHLLGTVADLSTVVADHQVTFIVVAVRGGLTPELTGQLLDCKALGVEIEDMPTTYKRLTGKVPIHHLSDASIIFGPTFSGSGRVAAGVQRVFDVVIALVGTVLTAPIVAVAGIAVRWESPGPAFFLQERLGRNERPFSIIKLRTMRQDAEATTGAVWSQGKGDPRVTRVGRFLRRSRIDEMPQFWNVLRGDMSIVGPRPEREHFVRRLKEQIPFYGLRFSVKPGVTGWAQVKYRYGATDEDAAEKLCYELYAVQEMSPALYFLTLLKTMQTVLLRPGS